MYLQRQFPSFLPQSRFSGGFNPGRVGMKSVGFGLEAAGNLLDLVAQPNEVGLLVAEQEPTGIGRSRCPHRGNMSGHQPVQHVVETAPDQIDIGPHPLAIHRLSPQVTGQRE